MKTTTSLLLSLLLYSAFAQKGNFQTIVNNYEPSLPVSHIQPEQQMMTESSVEEAITNMAGYDENIQLELAFTRSGKAFTHYHFDLKINGTKVYGGRVHAVLDHQQNVVSLSAPQVPGNILQEAFPEAGSAELVRQETGAQQVEESEPVYVLTPGGSLTSALKVKVEGPETLHREVIYTNEGIVYQQDLHKYFHQHDTTVSVLIFEPDPLSSAHTTYGGNYSDQNDASVPELNAERKSRTTTFNYENGVIRAENDFVKITEFSLPNAAPASSATTNEFYYTRDRSEFEDVNIVYHITEQRKYLASLGYPNLPSYQIQVDAHALSGADASFFSTASYPHRLYMGEGGVDDGEDADVILHEFSHSVIYEASPVSNTTPERACIEEALCDYFALSYSRSVNNFNDESVFNWDGHNNFWAGRNARTSKSYNNVTFENDKIYQNIAILTTPLLDIVNTIGRSATDELVIESLFHLGNSTTMKDFAQVMLLCDQAINNGMNEQVIKNAFAARGIFNTVGNSEYNTAGADIDLSGTYEFARGGMLKIRSNAARLASANLYDVQGRLVSSFDLQQAQQASISGSELPAGVYVLQVSDAAGRSLSTKVSRVLR